MAQETAEEEERTLEEVGSDGAGTGLEVEKPEFGDGAIKAPFDPAKIDVITQARTVDLLLTRLKEGEMDLSPEFQRRGNLWTDKRKSGLIESMILRIPIPSLYVSEDSNGNYTVVDGLQRMCAIAHFVKVEYLNAAVKSTLAPLRLAGLQSLPADYIGKGYADLPRPLQRRISETELTLHIIRASTPPAVKFNIFSRINQGGLPLAPQEIRNAIYPGEWRSRIKAMAESQEFKRATDFKLRGERMEDLELVLRFVAHFSLNPNEERPEKQNLDDFLNDFVQNKGLSWDSQKWSQAESAFLKVMKYSGQVFGRYAFRKYYGDNEYRRPINRGLFESEAVALARFSTTELTDMASKKDIILKKLAAVFNSDSGFNSSLLYATGRGGASNTRLHVLDRMFREVLSA
jgi:Protein of unknown function DUF262.